MEIERDALPRLAVVFAEYGTIAVVLLYQMPRSFGVDMCRRLYLAQLIGPLPLR